jgi:hypothetical protein
VYNEGVKPYLFAIAITLILLGCGSGNKLVGTWTGTVANMAADVTYTQDGKMTISFALPGEQFKGAIAKVNGTYKLEGDDLLVTMTSADIENLPAALAPMKSQIVQGMQAGIKVGKEEKSKLEWKDDDTVVMKNDKGEAITFTRKK